MRPERLAQIRDYISKPDVARSLPGSAHGYIVELIVAVEQSNQWPPPVGSQADPGQLFRRGHIVLQASREFQLITAIRLLASYAETFTHTPNAAEVVARVQNDLDATAGAAELIALKHETEWSDDDRRNILARRLAKKTLELAKAAAFFAAIRETVREEIGL